MRFVLGLLCVLLVCRPALADLTAQINSPSPSHHTAELHGHAPSTEQNSALAVTGNPPYPAEHSLSVSDDNPTLLLMLIGGLLVLLVQNAAVGFLTRKLSYLCYALYLLASLGYLLAISRLGQQHLWGQWSGFSLQAGSFFGCASVLLSLVFARVFLRLGQFTGWISMLNSLLMIYWLLLSVTTLLYPPLVMFLLPQWLLILTGIGTFASLLYLCYLSNISAQFFSLAWLLLMFSCALHGLVSWRLIEPDLWSQNSQLLGIFLQFVLLSVALSEQRNRERTQRITAQHNLLLSSRNLALAREEKLVAQERLLEIQQLANQELERRVRVRTEDLENAKQELEKANAELAALSSTDPLTKLFNRRHFDSAIADEMSRSQRAQTPISILMIDIDHFKNINDSYGHPFGDECLRQVAAIIHNNAKRAGDLPARYGGEEFILALPATDLEHAHIVAERIRSKTEALLMHFQEQEVRVTLSIGIASCQLERHTTIESLISRADSALYQAKHNGRNQVVGHS